MKNPSSHQKIAIGLILLLAVLVVGALVLVNGSSIYRTVLYNSMFQKLLLPSIQGACSEVEKVMTPENSIEDRLRDLTIPPSLRAAASVNSGSEAYRVFLLCLDGASWREIDELGSLPNFERLRNSGSWTVHESTLLPISSCAWNAIDTGYLPGQTGVLSFMKPSQDWPPQWMPLSTSAFPNTTTAQRVAKRGSGVFIINLMHSYPEQIPQGVVVGGLWTGAEVGFASPPELESQLVESGYSPHLNKCPRLRFLYLIGIVLALALVFDLNIGFRKRPKAKSTAYYSAIVIVFLLFSLVYWKRNSDFRTPKYAVQVYLEDEFNPRARMALHYFDQSNWRFGAIMVKGIDALSHSHYADKKSRWQRYRAADKLVGQLLDRLDRRTILAVVSDHGMRYFPKAFDLPAWLYNEGYQSDPNSPQAIAVHEFAGNVGCIRFKDSALLDEISSKLLSLQDTVTGQKIVTHVMKKEEVCEGEALNWMPDLIIETAPEYQVLAYAPKYWRKEKGRFQKAPIDDPLYKTDTPYGPPLKIYQDWYLGGNHERQGMFALVGGPVRPLGKADPVTIEDIAPTLMALLDVPLPKDLPGQPLLDWLSPNFSNIHPIRTVDDQAKVLSIDTNAVIDPETMKTLRTLDYLK